MLSGEFPSVIGRDSELDTLVAAISADRAIAVVGEAGVGKTALVRAASLASGRRLCEGGGFATLTHLPYLALRRAIDPGLSGDPADVAARVEERLGPDVLFIDDLQWVDRVTPMVLELLRGRVAFVLAIRAWDPGSEPASDLARRLGAAVLTLGGVDRAAAEGIVRRARPDLSSAAVDLVIARAGGNPLLLEELASRGEAPSTYARLIANRVRQLSPSGSRSVELLAVADRPLPGDIAGPGHAEAIEAGLALDAGSMVELRHALIGEVVRDGLGTVDRAAIHGALADLLDDPSEVARHLAAAGRGQEAAAVALAAVATSPDPRTTAALLVIVATSDPRSAGLGRRLEAAHALDRISDRQAVLDILADEPGAATPEQLAEREALLGRAAYALGRHAEARAHLEQAREVPVDPASAAAARVALERAEFAVNVDGAVIEALVLLDDQIPRHGPDSPEYWALRSIREGIRLAAGQEPDLRVLQQAIDGAIAGGELATAADLIRVVGFALLIREGAAPGAAFLRTSADRLAAAGVAGPALEVAAEVVAASILAGELVGAVTAADQVLERPAPLHARQVAAIHRARSLAMLGRHDAATDSLAMIEPFVTEDWFGRGEFLSAQADSALWAGRPDRAAELATTVLSVPTPLAAAYLMPTITRAWAQVELDIPPDVEITVEPTPSMAGAGPELEGLGLLQAGELPQAAERLEAAAERWLPFNVPRALACRWAAGDARRRAGSEGATADLLAVHGAVNEIGFEALAVRVRRSLRLAGVRLVRSDPVVRGAKLELTARESELLRLVEDGLSNIEIARRMGLGRPTVSRILSNAMSKLGVDSRAQAVAVATELD